MVQAKKFHLGPSVGGLYGEFTPSPRVSVGICQVTVKQWRVYVNGTSNTRGSGVGIVMVSLKGLRLEKSLRLGFRALNNETKYEAFIVGL